MIIKRYLMAISEVYNLDNERLRLRQGGGNKRVTCTYNVSKGVERKSCDLCNEMMLQETGSLNNVLSARPNCIAVLMRRKKSNTRLLIFRKPET